MGKLNISTVDKIINEKNLKRIGEYINNNTPILCIDSNGYRVFPTIKHLKANKNPRPFFKNNPYTIDNIKLYLNKHNPTIELLSNEYISSDTKLQCRCKIDGFIWYMSWDNLKNGQGCTKCARKTINEKNKNTIQYIKDKLYKMNSNLVIKETEYYGCNQKLNILCNKNHHFKKTWLELIRSPLCPVCSRINSTGGYNFTNAERNREKWINNNAIVYIVNMYNENENFYKIGITNRSIDKRLRYQVPYKYKVISQITTNMYDATYIEYELHYYHRNQQYNPLEEFYGRTECFKNIDTKLINKYEKFYRNFNRNAFEHQHILLFKEPINLNVCSDDALLLLLIRLNSYLMSAKDLNMTDFEISGYSVTAWIKDIKSKLEVSGLKKEESDLKKMESKLDKLLSDDKKTELEIDEIASLLK